MMQIEIALYAKFITQSSSQQLYYCRFTSSLTTRYQYS